MLRLRVILAIKTCLFIRSVSFITNSEIVVCRLANNAGSIPFGEHKRSKKRLQAAAVEVPKNTTSTSN